MEIDEANSVSELPPSLVINRQIRRFLVAGFSAVGTDALGYYVLTHVGLHHNIAKPLSFIAGTLVAYLINKYYTFEKTEKSATEVVRFGLLYIGTLLINTGVNALVYRLGGEPAKLLAFLCATGTSTILNFIGQKWWVFKG